MSATGDYLLRDDKTGLFLDDAAVHTIKLTRHQGFAWRFTNEAEAQFMVHSLKTVFGEFDFKPYPR